jgi:beta-lactamase superfamily II metal-dependent hydrolase
MLTIQALPADIGDCILIAYNNTNILIDTGTKRTYSKGWLKLLFREIDKIDLLILTHTDEDHIGGIIKYYQDEERVNGIIKKVWFNTGENICNELNLNNKSQTQISIIDNSELEMSVTQAKTLEKYLKDDDVLENFIIKSFDSYIFNEAKITILSPDISDLLIFLDDWELEEENNLDMATSKDYHYSIEELVSKNFVDDSSLANKVSIAFLFEYKDKKVLFMGDASPIIVKKNLKRIGYNSTDNKLKLDLLKISHHGSRSGTSSCLLEIINCDKFIISTSGKNGLPTKESLSRIIYPQKNERKDIYFNYLNEDFQHIFTREEIEKYNINLLFPNDHHYKLEF